ncbi:MAG: hypothetical protein NTX15_06675 [Candidatus Kapabacteria bacterium]|nr:hypothetical protein [Candidatus Kapabacteria bacterium]
MMIHVRVVATIALLFFCTSCDYNKDSVESIGHRRFDTLTNVSDWKVIEVVDRTIVVRNGDTVRMLKIIKDGSNIFERMEIDSGSALHYVDYDEVNGVQVLLNNAVGHVLNIRRSASSPWSSVKVPVTNVERSKMNASCFVFTSGDILVTFPDEWYLLNGQTRQWRVIRRPKTGIFGRPAIVRDVGNSTYLVGFDIGEWGGDLNRVTVAQSDTPRVETLTDECCTHIVQLDSQTYLATGGIYHLRYRDHSLFIVKDGVAISVATNRVLYDAGPVYDVRVVGKKVLIALGGLGVVQLNIVATRRGYRADVQRVYEYKDQYNGVDDRVVGVVSDTMALVSNFDTGISWLPLTPSYGDTVQ